MGRDEVLTTAKDVAAERAFQYGEEMLLIASKISSTVLNKNITPHDVAIILAALKLARIKDSKKKLDNYVDAINYLGFAAEYIEAE